MHEDCFALVGANGDDSLAEFHRWMMDGDAHCRLLKLSSAW
jgi:hypothetical protein